MSGIIDVLNWFREKGKTTGANILFLLFGVVITIIMLNIPIQHFGKNWADVWSYVASNETKQTHKELIDVLALTQEHFAALNKLSEKRHLKLWELLQKTKLSPSDVGVVLAINNRDRDALRSFLEYVEVLQAAANEGNISDELLDTIHSISQAYILIHQDDNASYLKAIDEFTGAYNIVGDNTRLKLEILRNVTYCCFATKPQSNVRFWQDESVKIRMAEKVEYCDYTKRYFWIDLNDLYLAVDGPEYNAKAAEEAFLRFTGSAPVDFVKIKLMQHRAHISTDRLEIWDTFIKRLN